MDIWNPNYSRRIRGPRTGLRPKKRRKVEPIRNPTLFPMERSAEPGRLASTLAVDRPFSLSGTGIFLRDLAHPNL